MADQDYIRFYGCIDHLCFYRMWNRDFVRMKSNLTGKRVKKDRAFVKTMQEAKLLGRAAKIASVVYRALPKEFRQFWMYRAFTGEIVVMLKGGKTEKEAEEIMLQIYVSVWNCKGENNQIEVKRTSAKVVVVAQNETRRQTSHKSTDQFNVNVVIQRGYYMQMMQGMGPPRSRAA